MMTTARSLAAATVTTVLLAGCVTASGAPPPATTGGYRLYAVDTQVGSAPISVIDAATGHLERTLPVGTPSPDWSRLYVLSHQQQKTTLAAVDTHRGSTLSQVSFDGWFDLPAINIAGPTGGLSPNGQWLVMQRSDDPGQTNFMVASTTFTQGPKRITLSGDFSFDAISNDGKRLYLVEGLAPSRPGYQVRLYDIDAGSLDPRIVVDKRETGPMAGTRVSGVFDPRGQWQYSLYVNEAKGPFIHALSLDGNLAWCIDLPAAGKRFEQMMWSLTLNAEGTALIAVNPALGKVARVDIGPEGPANEVSESSVFTPPVRQPAQAQGLITDALAKGIQVGSSALARDGKTLVAIADNGTISIQLPGLKPSRTLVNDEAVESVVMSDDGMTLFSSTWNGSTLRQINPLTGAPLRTLHLKTTYLLYRAERSK